MDKFIKDIEGKDIILPKDWETKYKIKVEEIEE